MAKNPFATTKSMVSKAKSGKGTLSFTPGKKFPAKKPGMSGDNPKKSKAPPFGKKK
jgi:hypothetical protein